MCVRVAVLCEEPDETRSYCLVPKVVGLATCALSVLRLALAVLEGAAHTAVASPQQSSASLPVSASQKIDEGEHVPLKGRSLSLSRTCPVRREHNVQNHNTHTPSQTQAQHAEYTQSPCSASRSPPVLSFQVRGRARLACRSNLAGVFDFAAMAMALASASAALLEFSSAAQWPAPDLRVGARDDDLRREEAVERSTAAAGVMGARAAAGSEATVGTRTLRTVAAFEPPLRAAVCAVADLLGVLEAAGWVCGCVRGAVADAAGTPRPAPTTEERKAHPPEMALPTLASRRPTPTPTPLPLRAAVSVSFRLALAFDAAVAARDAADGATPAQNCASAARNPTQSVSVSGPAHTGSPGEV